MVNATLVLMSVVLVVLAGEAVRSQCRRMLHRPRVAADAMARQVTAAVGHEVAA